MLRPQFVLLIWPKCCCCGNTHKGPTLRQTISGFSARLTPKKMLGNFVKMTKQNKTDNYSSLRSLWSPQTTRGDALSSETIGDSFTFTQTQQQCQANTLACRRHSPPWWSPLPHMAALFVQMPISCANWIARAVEGSANLVAVMTLQWAGETCHRLTRHTTAATATANCDCLNCVATNSVIPKRMQTNKLTHNYFELVSTSAHSLPSQEWVRLLLSLSIRIGDVWSSEWLGISRNFSNNEYDNYC